MNRSPGKSTRGKHPGPHTFGGLPLAENPSFFNENVQNILSRRHDKLGWPIKCWEMVEAVTRCYDPKRKHGFPSLMQFKDEESKQSFWRGRWLDFVNCYHRDPDFVAQLFAAMTSFHTLAPKNWPLALKVACLSTLGEREENQDMSRPNPPLRNPRKAEMLKEWFGNDIIPSRISIELSRERKRRLKICAKWQGHYDYLNEQIESRLTHTQAAKSM